MTTYSKGRRGRPWRRLCAQVYREETHCWLCGLWVDQTLPWRNPWSRSVDHVLPLIDYPHLALERSNARLAHRRCNGSKGRRTAATPDRLGRRSRTW